MSDAIFSSSQITPQRANMFRRKRRRKNLDERTRPITKTARKKTYENKPLNVFIEISAGT